MPIARLCHIAECCAVLEIPVILLSIQVHLYSTVQ